MNKYIADKSVEALAVVTLGLIAYFSLKELGVEAATVVGSISGMIGGYLTRGIVDKVRNKVRGGD